MLTTETRLTAEDILGHHLGKRVADEVLAHAAVRGHLGLLPRATFPGFSSIAPPVTIPGSILEGLPYARRFRAKHGAEVGRGLGPSPRKRRLWSLRRSWQLDQGNTPQCVAFTKKHWELAQPIGYRLGRTTPGADYRRMKQLDGYPDLEGTWFEFALQVAQEQGIVERHWQYQGPEDFDAVTQWILDVGPVAWGAYWPESMFRTDAAGLIEVVGEFKWGHQTLIIGTDIDAEEDIVLNSWGNTRFGIDGRGRLKWADRKRHFENGADLFGLVEQRHSA